MLRALQETTGSFSVLSANVAGLPAIISSGDPATNSVELGRRLSAWDIVNVQEDFNYHDQLLQANTHTYRTPHSGGVPFGSGLNTLSKYAFTDVGGLDRVKWSKCSTFDGADCLTPKGFTYLQVKLADGVFIDVYNLHADAGTTNADLDARKANINQVTDYILANSKDNAVIVFGDTNTRWTRAGDNIGSLASRASLTDGWVSKIRNGVPPVAGSDAIACSSEQMNNNCEVVDKILFRGNRLITLNHASFNIEKAQFLDAKGKDLSDHVPVSSVFSWTLNAALRMSNAVGGPHGTPFTDIGTVPIGQKVTSVSIRAANRVDGVALTAGGVTFTHGGSGGALTSLTLNSGEYLTSIELHTDKYNDRTRIFYVKFTTSTGRSLSGGKTTANKTTYTAPSGWQIAGFHGRQGDEMDALGVIYTRQ